MKKSDKTGNTLDISFLNRIFNNNIKEEMSTDFFFNKLSEQQLAVISNHLVCIDFYMTFYCTKGQVTIEHNTEFNTVAEGSFMIAVPGSYLVISPEENSSFLLVAATPELLSSVKFDFGRLYRETPFMYSNPIISLTENERIVSSQYISLAESLIHSELKDLKTVIIPILTSLFSYFGEIVTTRINEASSDSGFKGKQARLFDKFIKLVSTHYIKEKSIGFYASELYLTPKYLSSLVLKISGKSASEWIDFYLTLQAKNYLRYSELPIKEIAYLLGYSSSPVFHRSFKSQTGLTPLEYREQRKDIL